MTYIKTDLEKSACLELIIKTLKSNQIENNFEISLILNCIHKDKSLLSDRIKRIGCKILNKNVYEDGSWNYHFKKSTEAHIKTKYPNDLDDSVCAFLALKRSDIFFEYGKALAKLIKTIKTNEVKNGGPYYTWIINGERKKWDDIDVGVNANILNLFSELKSNPPPGLISYINKKIQKGDFSSKYYNHPLMIMYFLSQNNNLSDTIRKTLTKYLLERVYFNDDLSKKIWLPVLISTKMNLRIKLDKKEVTALLSQKSPEQDKDFIKSEKGFYIERIENNHPKYFYSRALWLAFKVEVLNKLENIHKLKSGILKEKTNKKIIKRIKRTNIINSKEICRPFVKRINSRIEYFWNKSQSVKEAATFPSILNQSIYKKCSDKNINSTIKKIELLNILGWIGWTTIDDILDEKYVLNSKKSERDACNLIINKIAGLYCFRKFITGYKDLFNKNANSKIIERIFGDIDSAIFKEKTLSINKNEELTIKYLDRFKKISFDNEIVFKKSAMYKLAPIYILINAGYRANGQEVKLMESFFDYFIFIKQTSDDSKDWRDDFIDGLNTPVISLMVNLLKEKEPELNKKDINKNNILKHLEDIFKTQVKGILFREIISKAKKSINIIEKMNFIEDKNILRNMIFEIITPSIELMNQMDFIESISKNRP